MALWGSDDPFIDRIADLQDFKEVKEGKFSFGEELKAPKLALAKSLDDDENKDEDKFTKKDWRSMGYGSLDDDDYVDQTEEIPMTLGGALGSFVGKDRLSDVVFLVGPDAKEIPAHRMFLAVRNPVFELMLYPPEGESQEVKGRLEIRVPDVKPEAFTTMLQCIYSGQAADIDPDNIADLVYVARKYCVDQLRTAIANFIKDGITTQNACLLLETEALEDQESIAKYIEDNFDQVSLSEGFTRLSEKNLIRFLKSNKLFVREVELFDAAREWAHAECNRRGVMDDEKHMKEILKPIVPFIRFPIMTMEDIASSVQPSGLVDDVELLHVFTFLGAKGGEYKGSFSTEQRLGKITWKWDSKRKQSGLTLSEQNRSVGTQNSPSSWCMALGDTDLKEGGIYEFEVVLTQYSNSHGWNVLIGVVPSSFSNYSGTVFGYSNTAGWALVTGSGQICTSSKGYSPVPYTSNFQQGDKVGVRCDLRKKPGTISYFKNGKSCGGIAFGDVTGPVRPAVGLIYQQRVTVSFDALKFNTERAATAADAPLV